jgi:hypothetical protein
MIISQAPAGGTKTNQSAPKSQQQADATNAFMNDWESKNPTGYSSASEFMDNDPNGFDAYQAARKSAYDSFAASQPQAGAGMGIISSQTQPQVQTMQAQAQPQTQATQLSPGGVNTVSQHQTQGYPASTPQTAATPSGIVAAAQGTPQVQTMAAPGGAPTNSGPNGGGIISNNISGNVDQNGQIVNTQGYNAAQTGPAKNWDVTSEQTMQGQLQNYMAHDNPLMQMARARAIEQMNSRGLANSSMALGASEAAAYDTALPIVQNDANVYANAAKSNTDTANQFTLQNTGFQNQALQFNAGEANTAGRTNASNLTNTNIGAAQNASQEKIAAGHDTTTLTAGREQNASQEKIAQGNQDTTRWTAQLNSDTNLKLGQLDADTRTYIADQDVGVRRELGYLDANTQKYVADQNASVARSAQDVQRELGYLDANTRTNIANMSNATQLQVADLSNQYQQQISASNSMQQFMQNSTAQIAAIDRDPNLSVEGKANAIQRQIAQTRDTLNMMGQISNIPNLGQYYSGNYVG